MSLQKSQAVAAIIHNANILSENEKVCDENSEFYDQNMNPKMKLTHNSEKNIEVVAIKVIFEEIIKSN